MMDVEIPAKIRRAEGCVVRALAVRKRSKWKIVVALGIEVFATRRRRDEQRHAFH